MGEEEWEEDEAMSNYTQKLIPLTRESAALAWAVNGKPVFAEVNGLCQQITPVGTGPCMYGDQRWSCRVLEEEAARFYMSVEAIA
jgi:hypothetical protein